MGLTCPVCGYGGLAEPAYDEHGCSSFEICPSCGTEFGYDDALRTHAELRADWSAAGRPWRSSVHPQPPGWDPQAQLDAAGLE